MVQPSLVIALSCAAVWGTAVGRVSSELKFFHPGPIWPVWWGLSERCAIAPIDDVRFRGLQAALTPAVDVPSGCTQLVGQTDGTLRRATVAVAKVQLYGVLWDPAGLDF